MALHQLYSQSQKYLTSARRSWLCALEILLKVDGAESEVALHISRAWYYVSCALASSSGHAIPDFTDNISVLDLSFLRFSPALSREQWENDLALFHRLTHPFPAPQTDRHLLTTTSLKLHCNFLDEVISTVTRQIKKKLGITLLSSKVLKKSLKVIAVIFLVLLIGSFIHSAVQRTEVTGSGPWRTQFFSNIDLSGKPAKTSKHKQVDSLWSTIGPAGSTEDDFSIRWDTCLNLDNTTLVKFSLGSDDGSRLKVNGKTVMDLWSKHGYFIKNEKIELPEGVHHLEVEFYEEGGAAKVSFTANPKLLTEEYLSYPSKKQKPCKSKRR